MTLSIVIVNYNVKYFLEQCLESVFGSDLTMECDSSCKESNTNSSSQFQLEVFVVDNASVDGSVEMVKERFPKVQLIANRDNVGFAKANNQALRQCTGDLVLLLNPDTVVEHDTFRKCVGFFATHHDCGGMGVKMVDGEGSYLKESKRGFPTPAAAFFKISGIIHFFPHHRRIAAYYMGHLDENETNPIDSLPGAYLMVRRDVLDKVGLLDESYFMYGEDIDFSWRIRLAGFQNYYLPSARIIHYKGECTKHGSMNYVYTFYNAMAIFVQHYFSGSRARWFNFLLHIAIWARATLSWLKRALQAVALPVADFGVAFAGFYGLKQLWATYHAANVDYYPSQYTYFVIPIYILILMLCSWLYGGYAKPVRLSRMIKGMAVGCGLLIVFYSLLDESQRYSRALLLLGCGWTLISSLGIRAILSILHFPGYNLRPLRTRSCLIVGGDEEVQRVRQLYESLGSIQIESITNLPPDLNQLNDTIRYYNADEVLFCSRDLTIQEIIDLMTQLSHLPGNRRQVEYKIAPSDSDFIIGSHSISRAEDLYTEELRTIADPLNCRNKRLLDIITSLFLILLSPILFPFQQRKREYFHHCWQVLTGKKSWVGTTNGETPSGIFAPEDALPRRASSLSPELRQRLQLRYLRNYHLTTDLQILFKNLLNI
ncbi:MAG: glycosyltransferase [Bacteroidales bacterium]|nr:glycosyltransferase [Bacteroidales bacterium]